MYSYFMPVWGIVKTAALRFHGQLDALLPKAEGNGASSCPRYRGAVVLSTPPNSHEMTVLLPNQCWKSQCFRQEMLAELARDVGTHNFPRDVRRHSCDVWLRLNGWRHKRGGKVDSVTSWWRHMSDFPCIWLRHIPIKLQLIQIVKTTHYSVYSRLGNNS